MLSGIITVSAFLLLLLRVIILLSPEWSEKYGRSQISHAQALRNGRALVRTAWRVYKKTFTDTNTELERVMF